MTSSRSFDESLLEIAASWKLRLDDARPHERVKVELELREWLVADPNHIAAYNQACGAWNKIGQLANAPELLDLRTRALSGARSSAKARFRSSHRMVWRFLAASVALIAILGIAAWLALPRDQIYQTQVAERRLVTLADNSHVDIDANSAISVHFSRDVRLIKLLKGQAYFQVEHDVGRPFVVEAAGRRVVATGTEFNVEMIGSTVKVLLVQGHVVVGTADASSVLPSTREADMSPGQELIAPPQGTIKLLRFANVEGTTSWRSGKLLFDDQSLTDAVARMQRYSRIKIIIDDPALAKIRVSGVFNAGDVTAFVGALKDAYPIQVSSDGSDELHLSHKN